MIANIGNAKHYKTNHFGALVCELLRSERMSAIQRPIWWFWCLSMSGMGYSP